MAHQSPSTAVATPPVRQGNKIVICPQVLPAMAAVTEALQRATPEGRAAAQREAAAAAAAEAAMRELLLQVSPLSILSAVRLHAIGESPWREPVMPDGSSSSSCHRHCTAAAAAAVALRVPCQRPAFWMPSGRC